MVWADTTTLTTVSAFCLLDGLVLADAAGAVGAADGLGMAAALLGQTVVPPLLRRHRQRKNLNV